MTIPAGTLVPRDARDFGNYQLIAKLATEFARGGDAVLKVTGKSLDALNADFREWGFHHNGEFALDERWPYDDLYSPGIDPRIRAGFKFGKRDR